MALCNVGGIRCGQVGISSSEGALPGGTVVQLYFSQALAQAVRPKLMLLAFEKVERTAGKATLTVPIADLGYYHPLTKKTSVDPGSYTLQVGASSAQLAQGSLALALK